MVFCAVDYLSNKAVLEPTTSTVTSDGLAYLWRTGVWRHYGSPTTLISDREPRALASAFQKQTQDFGTSHRVSTARHQQTDGKTERMIQAIKAILRPYLSYNGGNWVDILPLVEFQWNSAVNPATGFSPFEVERGSQPFHPVSANQEDDRPLRLPDAASNAALQETLSAIAAAVQQQLRNAQDAQAALHDRGRRAVRFKPGDLVLLHRDGISAPYLRAKPEKLNVLWLGPFTIKSPGPNPSTYELELPLQHRRLHPVFHVDVLKHYHARSNEQPPPPEELDGYLEYKVESILREKRVGRKTQFYVKWEGWTLEHCTWEPAKELKDCAALDAWRAAGNKPK